MKGTSVLAVAMMMGSLVAPISPAAARGSQDTSSDDGILDFHTMVGVTPPFTGPTNAIRGVPGAGLPWVIDRADGELRADGHFEVRVSGLVLASVAPVPANLQGTNPLPQFSAIISCLSISSGAAVTVNVRTANFPADPAGDAQLETDVTLPHPCIAPIVFVTTVGGAWLASTGNN
jgi:hypothetical protein